MAHTIQLDKKNFHNIQQTKMKELWDNKEDEDRENAVDLPLSTLHPSQGMLISLELWNSFSETILEKMPHLKPKN